MEQVFNILYFAFFLISTILFLKLLMSTNMEKIFKQGKVFEIRLTYLLISFILSFLFATSVVKLMETIYQIIIK